ncbi:MAG: hypothetical protein U5J83_01505 [Bryobacterales bacterium]|nr:hypothetical protein [Bryobacterales bacterium]
MLVEAGGGLEHKNSTVLMTSAWTTRNDDAFYGNPSATPPRGGWVSLVSHEYFHLWNVKRLRPRALGPFDYETENYTDSLWISEGITSYYDDLAMVRTGLIDRKNYLARLSGSIGALQARPGRKMQSAAESSYDAWIKGYRPDENSPGHRHQLLHDGQRDWLSAGTPASGAATGNAKSLDDAMRLAYQRLGAPSASRRRLPELPGESPGPSWRNGLIKAEYQTADASTMLRITSRRLFVLTALQ